jgi:hypothetical protein
MWKFIRRLLRMETKDALLYRRYTVEIEFLNGIAGGTPFNKSLIADHIHRFAAEVTNALQLSKKQEGEVSDEAMQKYMMSCSSGFLLDDKGIYIRGYQFNAMLKDAAQRMKATITHRGLGNTIRDGGLLFPDKVYLGVEPTIIEKPVKPDNGPANIKIFQVAEGVKLTVPCAILDNGDLGDTLFRQIFIVAQNIGLGANRHLGYGRFRVTNLQEEGDWEITDLWKDGVNVDTSPVPETV